MGTIEIQPIRKTVTTAVSIPGSKSYTNRALIMAAMTPGPVVINNYLASDDTKAMIDCLKSLGLRIEPSTESLVVYDDFSTIKERCVDLYCRDSGTTIRFLLPFLCLIPGKKILKGSARLNERPIKPLVDALVSLGASIDFFDKEGQPPLQINSSKLRSNGKIVLDASLSSQFLSAILMVAPLLNGLEIILSNPVISKPYADMTIAMMQEWGIRDIRSNKNGYLIPSGQHYAIQEYLIEGDFSSASYFFAIAALTRSIITVRNINPSSLQADRKFLDLLMAMGNQIEIGEKSITFMGSGIVPVDVDMEEFPDQVQTMAVLAAFADGVTTIHGVRSLRVKETERILALKTELAKMGIQTEETFNTFKVYGGNPKAAVIETYGDHRMAMAFAVAGTKIPGMKISSSEVVNKTFPSFWDQLRAL